MGWGIALIGLISGLVTGLSPCILPVLPIVLAVSADKRRKPWLVATGIGLSFTLVTLLGTLILSALGLTKDLLRWAGVVLLVLVGVSMLWPALGDQLERPFARIRIPGWIQRITRGGGSGADRLGQRGAGGQLRGRRVYALVLLCASWQADRYAGGFRAFPPQGHLFWRGRAGDRAGCCDCVQRSGDTAAGATGLDRGRAGAVQRFRQDPECFAAGQRRWRG